MEGSKREDLNDYARKMIRHKARQLIGRYGFTPDDYGDLKQEMALDLLIRLSKFDPNKAGLNTFVSRVIDRKVATIIRHRKQGKRDYRCEVCSLDESIGGEDRVVGMPGERPDEHDLSLGTVTQSASDRMDLRLDLSIAIEDLTPELQHLVGVLFTHTISEAARELGVARSTLYAKGIARLRKVFEDKGLHEYL